MSVGESKWTGEGMGQGHYCKQAPPEGVSADPYYFSALAPGRKCIFASLCAKLHIEADIGVQIVIMSKI